MQIFSIGEMSKRTGYATQTFRNWEAKGILLPYSKSVSGKRFYTEDQLNELLGKSTISEKLVVGYCRVSSSKQKDDLDRQVSNMETYLTAKGKPFTIISDIGSGINYKNKGLKSIISMINSGSIDTLVIFYKDRLVRFGFELIEYFAELNSVKIEIVEPKKASEEEELVTDLIQIVTVFSARLQGKRANKTKKLIKELNENVQDT